jgi:hypothetical protein
LGEALLVLAHRHAGYLGLGLLAGVVFAGTFAWLYRILLRESKDPAASLLVTVITAQVTLLQFLVRPLIFSFPLFLGAVELARGPGKRALVLLPLLTAVWANVHPSATMAPAIAAFFWLRRPGWNRLGLAALLSLLALGVTPWGYRWIVEMVAANRAYFSQVEEWLPQFAVRFILFGIRSLWRRAGSTALPAVLWLWGLGWLGCALSARLGPMHSWPGRLSLPGSGSGAVLGWSPARDLDGPQGRALDGLIFTPGVASAGQAGALFAGSLAPCTTGSEGFPGASPAAGRAARLARPACLQLRLGRLGRGRTGGRSSSTARQFGPVAPGLPDHLHRIPGWEEVLRRLDWLLVSPDALVAAATRRPVGSVYEDKTAACSFPTPP